MAEMMRCACAYVCVALVFWTAVASSVDDHDLDLHDGSSSDTLVHDAPAEEEQMSRYLYFEPYLRAGNESSLERTSEMTEYLSLDSLKDLSDEQIWERLTEGRKKNPIRSIQNKLTDRYTDVMFGDSTYSDRGHVNNDLTNSKAPESNHGQPHWFDNEPLLQSSLGVGAQLETEFPVNVLNKRNPKSALDQKDNEASSSLAFVFDTTGSMWDDLVQVRHGAAKILDTMLTRADRPVSHYVLVPFHDPRKSHSTEYTILNYFVFYTYLILILGFVCILASFQFLIRKKNLANIIINIIL